MQKKAVRTVWSGSVFGGPPNSAAPWAGSITLKVSANPVSEACPKTGASLGERGGRPKGSGQMTLALSIIQMSNRESIGG